MIERVTLVLMLAALPLSAAEGRIRIENTGSSGRVEIVVSDETVRTVEINVAGAASGEMMTVEAPAPIVRLSGGTFEGDVLLEAKVREKMSASRPARPTVSVLGAPPPLRIQTTRSLNEVFTGVGYALDAGFALAPVGFPRYTARSCGQARPSAQRVSRRSFSTSTRRATGTSRAMMPRR